MMLFTVFQCVLLLAVVTDSEVTFPTKVPYSKSTCPTIIYGKMEPSPEKDLKACKNYGCNSCCRSNITAELANVPLGQVGMVSYEQCLIGNKTESMSIACSMDTTYLECFYQCSPNLFPWISPITKKLSKVPICASFCDAWFYACKSDLTCVTGKGNWKTGLYLGFEADGSPKHPCKEGVRCRNYTEVYESGENMCNTIWGDLFVYTPDDELCLNPAMPDENAKMVQSIDESYNVSACVTKPVNYVDAGLIVGVVFGVLAGLFLVAGVVLYLMKRRKKGKNSPASGQRSNRERAKPEEVVSLKASTKQNPPKSSNVADHSSSEAEEA